MAPNPPPRYSARVNALTACRKEVRLAAALPSAEREEASAPQLPGVGFTAGSMFAGMGGFCLGFRLEGFKVAWAVDCDRFAAMTYRANFPDTRMVEEAVENLAAAQLEPVDVLLAGFPCQPFSVAGSKSGFADPRGRAFFEMMRIVREFGEARPKVLLFENVPHLLTHDGGRSFARVTAEIRAAGYWFDPLRNRAVLDAAQHAGLPQNRPRLFMAAVSAAWARRNKFRFPQAGEGGPPADPESLLDTSRPADPWHYFQPGTKWHAMFTAAMQSEPGSLFYHLRRNYVRPVRGRAAPALMAHMGDGGHNVPVIRDPWGIRKLTVEECLRLQGFDPESFVFPPALSRSRRYRQIGNAVAVPVARLLARACAAVLKEPIRGEAGE